MADDAPAPTPVPGVDYGALIQQIMQGGSGITGPAAPATPAVNTNLPVASLLGEALGGGVSPLYPMSEAQQTQAGNAALLNFGINMLQNSSGPVRHSLGQAIASGLLGAQGSLAGVREGQAQMLDVQNKQQTMQLEKIKTLLPLLMRQQAAGMPNPLLGGGAPGSLAATGDPLSALPKDQALAGIVQRESGGRNVNTEILDPQTGKPASTASGYYQMVDGTWQEAARLAGLKNPPPRAIDASRADQDAAASALYDKRGLQDWARSAPGTTRTATAPPATTTAPTASTAPPGVQMGGTPPAPPGGSTGPYAGGGIGAALAPPKPDIATSPTLRGPGAPVPSAPARVSGDVGAIQAGRQLAQIAPPVTALTAGPGAPTATATAAPAAPQPGWGSTVGTYGLPGQTPPATPPTVTPPAQPTPQQPTQADQPPAPTGPLTFEQFQAQHPITIDPRTFTVTPPNLDNLQRALNEATQRRDLALKGYGGNVDKAGSDYREASKAMVDAQQAAQTKSLELRQAAQKNALDTQRQLYNDDMTRQQQAKLEADKLAQAVAEADKQRAAAIALKTQEGQQAIDLANVNAGISTSTKLQEAYNTDAQNSGKRIDDLELLRGLSDNAGTPTLLTNIKIGDRSLADIISTTGFGGKDLQDKVGAVQAFRAGILNTVRELRSGGAATGEPRSNQDLQFVQDMAPNEWQNPATRSAIISFLQQVNQRRIDMAGEISRLTATRGTNGQLMPAGEAVGQARKNLPDFVQTVPAEAMGNTPAQVQARKDWFNTNVPAHTFFRYPNGRIDLYNGPGGQ